MWTTQRRLGSKT